MCAHRNHRLCFHKCSTVFIIHSSIYMYVYIRKIPATFHTLSASKLNIQWTNNSHNHHDIRFTTTQPSTQQCSAVNELLWNFKTLINSFQLINYFQFCILHRILRHIFDLNLLGNSIHIGKCEMWARHEMTNFVSSLNKLKTAMCAIWLILCLASNLW